jgi:uncharacterized membrane protein YidH (DUF202 family)
MYSFVRSFIYLLTVYSHFTFMKKFITGALLMGPALAFAQTPLQTTLGTFQTVINFLIPLMISLAVLVFFWGLVKYIANASDEAAKESGKTLMIWGMIALFVMVAFWGIIGYVQSTLNLSGTVSVTTAPAVNVVPSV